MTEFPRCNYCEKTSTAFYFSYFDDKKIAVCVDHIEDHPCIWCGSTKRGHDSFYNDLVIHEDDSPTMKKIKMQRQDRLAANKE